MTVWEKIKKIKTIYIRTADTYIQWINLLNAAFTFLAIYATMIVQFENNRQVTVTHSDACHTAAVQRADCVQRPISFAHFVIPCR